MAEKKIVLLGSLGLSILLIVSNAVGTFKLCGGHEYGQCMDILFSIVASSVIVFPVFIFALITYKMRDEVFRAWSHFAYWWVPLTFFISLIALNSSRSGSFGGLIWDWYMSIIVLTFHTLFILISLFIIIRKYLATRGSR